MYVLLTFYYLAGYSMVFNATVNHISVSYYIVVVSFIGGGNRSTGRKLPTSRKPLTKFNTYTCIEYISPWAEFELS